MPARGPGLFIVELATPRPTAPIELSRVGKWLERVPSLTLDGSRPSSRALSARLASFWLPSQPVLYIGATSVSVGARVTAMERTVLGDRRPHSGGHWLKTLNLPVATRVFWASTPAVEEYEDALLAAFEASVSATEKAASPDPAVVLPWANLRRATGERKATGIANSLLLEPAAPPPPPKRVRVVPDGDAEGARGEPPAKKTRASAAPKPPADPKPPASPKPSAAATRAARAPGASTAGSVSPAGTMTAEGAERIRLELAELTGVKRPEVIARIRSAKELGDLKENADYTSAREEQSFLEGRIQALEQRLRDAVIAEAPAPGSRADIGSVITLEIDGDAITYTLVGSAEADAAAGRLSVASPVGRALLGAMPGDEVSVSTPRGPVTYKVTELA